MGRLEHVDELDEIIQDWIGTRTKDEVLVAFRTGEAAIAPIYSIADIMDDPHYAARDALVRIPDDRLGSVLMQAPVPKLDVTPGSISHAGPTIGKHNRDVFVCELGLTEDTLDQLGAEGIV
jgi:formyl-CoA transferase